MTERNYWLILGAILAGIGVSAGAAGAHFLRNIISETRFITFNKAVSKARKILEHGWLAFFSRNSTF